MNQQQNLPTEPNAPEQAAAEREPTLSRGTLLSPWMRRHFARLNARRRGLASTTQPLTLLRRVSRPVGTALTEPRIGALHPVRLERFSRTITERAQTTRLVGIRRPAASAITAAPVWDSDIEMTLPGGAPAATGQFIERFPPVTPGTFAVGQPIEPFRPTPTAPDRPTRPAVAKPARQPARPSTKKEFPAQTRRYTRVEEITPQGEAPLAEDQEARPQPATMPAPPQSTPAPPAPATVQRAPEPPPVTVQAATPQLQEPARVAAEPATPIPAPPVIQRQTAPAPPTPKTPRRTAPEPHTDVAASTLTAPRSDITPLPVMPRETTPITPPRITAPPTMPEPPQTATEPVATLPSQPEPAAHPPRAVVEPLHPTQPRPPRALPVNGERRVASSEWRVAGIPEKKVDAIKPVAAPEAREPVPPVGQHIPESPAMQMRPAQTQESMPAHPPVETQPPPVHLLPSTVYSQPTQLPSPVTAPPELDLFATPPAVAHTAPGAPPAESIPTTPAPPQTPSESLTLPAATEPSGEEPTLRQIIQRRADARRHGLVRAPAALPIVRPIATASRQARPTPLPSPAPKRAAPQFQADVADKLHMQTTPGAPVIEQPPTPPQPLAPPQRSLLTVTTSPTLYARSPNLYIGPRRAPTVSQQRATRQTQQRTGEPLPLDDAHAAMHALLHPETPLILPPSPRPTPASAITRPPSPPHVTTPPDHIAEPGVMPLTRQPERQPAPLVQPAPTPTRAAELVTQPAIVGELIQREPAMQRAETEETAPETIDLTALARRVYPFVKRLIAVERERGAR